MSKKEIVIILILAIIACLRFLFFIPKAPPYDELVGKNVIFEGIINDDPDIRAKNQQLKIKLKEKDINILVVTDRGKDISYGDFVKVSGVLLKPENFITKTGKEFNYKRYLANQDIYFMIRNADIEILSIGNGSKIKSLLFKLKNKYIENIDKIIPMPESSLANGLLLGVRGSFDEDMKEEFISTGTIHIIALSGYNVSIVAEGVMKFFQIIFSQAVSIIFGIVVVILFIIMTGASATAIRAGIMATIMLLGRITGRNYLAGRALIIAGLLMITYDPRTISDMSFQLSFVATGGVLFLTPKIIHWFKFLPMRFKIREMVASTVSASIAVLPILLYLTGRLSLVSIPANVLILMFIPIVMFLIFVTGSLGFISSALSIPFGFLSYLILLYIISVIHFFSNIHFANISVLYFPLILVIFIYALLIWLIFGKNQ